MNDTTTNELILSEIIKLNGGIQLLHKADDEIKDLIKTSEIRLDERFDSVIEAINFVGNKVFDNHERRIVALETKST